MTSSYELAKKLALNLSRIYPNDAFVALPPCGGCFVWAGDEVLWERDDRTQTIVLRLDAGSSKGHEEKGVVEQNNAQSWCARYTEEFSTTSMYSRNVHFSVKAESVSVALSVLRNTRFYENRNVQHTAIGQTKFSAILLPIF